MSFIKLKELTGQYLPVMIIEPAEDQALRLLVNIDGETREVTENSGNAYRRTLLDDILDEVAGYKIGDLFIYAKDQILSPRIPDQYHATDYDNGVIHLYKKPEAVKQPNLTVVQ